MKNLQVLSHPWHQFKLTQRKWWITQDRHFESFTFSLKSTIYKKFNILKVKEIWVNLEAKKFHFLKYKKFFRGGVLKIFSSIVLKVR